MAVKLQKSPLLSLCVHGHCPPHLRTVSHKYVDGIPLVVCAFFSSVKWQLVRKCILFFIIQFWCIHTLCPFKYFPSTLIVSYWCNNPCLELSCCPFAPSFAVSQNERPLDFGQSLRFDSRPRPIISHHASARQWRKWLLPELKWTVFKD